MDQQPDAITAQTSGKPGWMAIALIASFVLAAVAMFAIGARLVKRTPGPDVSTVAIVPFSDLDGGTEGAQFSRGLEGAVSKTLSLHLTPVPQAATLIQGTVQTSADRIRVAVWLVRASDRRALWSQRYDLAPNDAPALHAELIRNILNALHLPADAAPVRN